MSVARSHFYSLNEQTNHAPLNDEMDPETAALVAKFALEDLEAATSRRKGKSRSGAPISDAEYAYQLQSENYKELLTFAEDVKYAQSLSSAPETDVARLEAIIIAEETARQDRRMAEMLSRGERLSLTAAWQTVKRSKNRKPGMTGRDTSPNVPVKLAKGKQKAVQVTKQGPAGTFAPTHESAVEDIDYDYNYESPYLSRNNKPAHNNMSSAGSGPSGSRNKTVKCTVCEDSVAYDKALHTQCDHHYCRECTSSLVYNFTRDESLYPLRCCQDPIPITSVDPFISSALKTLFLDKHGEFSTPPQNRLYCVNPTCSTFLGSSEDMMDTGIICPTCQTSTCPQCKQADHGEETCKVHAATLELRAMARQAGWQICPGCHTLVELSMGGYRITCRCRTQFCYLCAAPWKTCECPPWDEAGRVEAAEQRIENELGNRAFRRVAREVMTQHVNDKVGELRANHQCDAHNWRMRYGGGNCEECNDSVRRFLMLCRNCSLLLCRRCAHNRA